jgi:hypothetical protein
MLPTHCLYPTCSVTLQEMEAKMSHVVNNGSGSGSARTSLLPPSSVKGEKGQGPEKEREEGPVDGLGKRTASMRFKSSFSFLGMSR